MPVFSEIESGFVATGGSSRLTLSIPVPSSPANGEIRERITLSEGENVYFALQHTSLGDPLPGALTQAEIEAALTTTTEAWRDWSDIHQSYDGPWQDLVHHSGRVLQSLSYQPTGAIIAAATTSLPEEIGGDRNWDYRYSWVRDASFTMKALWVAACPDEAHEFFGFVTAALRIPARPSPADHVRDRRRARPV